MRFIAKRMITNNPLMQAGERIFLYTTSNPILYKKGDVLVTLEQPLSINAFHHPGEFDFNAFARKQNIAFTLYARSEQLVHFPIEQSILENFLLAANRWTRRVIQKWISHPANRPLAEAMLIGYRDELDQQQLNAYTQTGVVHIIAISGMHLALIFLLLDRAVQLVVYGRKKALLSLIIVVPFLWLFALLTGASASVLRSVVMFTLIGIGNALHRKNLTINVLFASAFLLLVNDPKRLEDLGFQLSYAAVLSILLFQKPIEQLLVLKHPGAKMIWSLVAVTLSAQILTTPIVLYHFNRFPTLFLIANMVAVPLSSCILILEIVLCAVSWVPWVAGTIGTVTSDSISFLNYFVTVLSRVPFASIPLLPSSMATLCGWFLLITAIHYFLKQPSPHSSTVILVSLLIQGALRNMDHYRIHQKKELGIFHIRGATTIFHRHGTSATLTISPDTIVHKWSQRYIQTAGPTLGIVHWNRKELSTDPLLIQFVSRDAESGNRFVISGWPTALPPHLLLHFLHKNDAVVLDGTVPVWKISQWKSALQPLDLRLHFTAQKGPLIMDCTPFHDALPKP